MDLGKIETDFSIFIVSGTVAYLDDPLLFRLQDGAETTFDGMNAVIAAGSFSLSPGGSACVTIDPNDVTLAPCPTTPALTFESAVPGKKSTELVCPLTFLPWLITNVLAA